MMFFIHHVQTYKNVKRLAKDLGVKQVHVVANKIRDEKDEEFEINVESTLLDLYEKVGILKERIERLENERRG